MGDSCHNSSGYHGPNSTLRRPAATGVEPEKRPKKPDEPDRNSEQPLEPVQSADNGERMEFRSKSLNK